MVFMGNSSWCPGTSRLRDGWAVRVPGWMRGLLYTILRKVKRSGFSCEMRGLYGMGPSGRGKECLTRPVLPLCYAPRAETMKPFRVHVFGRRFGKRAARTFPYTPLSYHNLLKTFPAGRNDAARHGRVETWRK